MINNKIDEETIWLFSRTYGLGTNEEEREANNRSSQQISEFGWKKNFCKLAKISFY